MEEMQMADKLVKVIMVVFIALWMIALPQAFWQKYNYCLGWKIITAIGEIVVFLIFIKDFSVFKGLDSAVDNFIGALFLSSAVILAPAIILFFSNSLPGLIGILIGIMISVDLLATVWIVRMANLYPSL